MERIAVLSDVHGNVTAFRAVLADIEARGITTVLNLGDVVGKGPRGSQCVVMSRQVCAVTVRGNWDDFLPRREPARGPADRAGQDGAGQDGVGQDGVVPDGEAALAWWHAELTDDDRAWLLGLPLVHHLELSGRRIRLVHASAASLYTKVFFHHTPEEFAAMFATTELTGTGPAPDVVGYGDVHDAYVETFEGRTLFNAGSVGNPLDETTASYVVLEGVPGGTRADTFGLAFVRVPYDIEAEVAVAAGLGMPALTEYASELRTAVYRGRGED